jgi:hypothetical protein
MKPFYGIGHFRFFMIAVLIIGMKVRFSGVDGSNGLIPESGLLLQDLRRQQSTRPRKPAPARMTCNQGATGPTNAIASLSTEAKVDLLRTPAQTGCRCNEGSNLKTR